MNSKALLIGAALVAVYLVMRARVAAAAPVISTVLRPSPIYMPTPAPLSVDVNTLPYQGTYTANGPLDLGTYGGQIYD